jgi:hypothetical protein
MRSHRSLGRSAAEAQDLVPAMQLSSEGAARTHGEDGLLNSLSDLSPFLPLGVITDEEFGRFSESTRALLLIDI